jgi:RND family efflux transporter MFP subunit
MDIPSSARTGRVRRMLRSIVWRSYAMGLLVSVAAGSAYMVFGPKSTQAQSSAQTATTTAQTRSIVTTVKGVGTVTFSSQQKLSFNQRGTVTKVNVKEGDMVKKGQIIAQLDDASVQASLRQAQLAIQASNLQLAQLVGDKPKTLADAQNAIAQQQRQLEEARDTLTVTAQQQPTTIAQAQRDVESKKTALAQAQLDLEQAKTNQVKTQADLQASNDTAIQNAALEPQAILTSAEKLLDSFYGILTQGTSARPAAGNYDLEISHYLYNDPNAAQQAKNSYLDAVNAAAAMHAQYGSSLAGERDPQKIRDALATAQALAGSVQKLGENTYAMMQGATTDTTRFSVAALQSARDSVNGNRASAQALVKEAQTAQTNIVDALNPAIDTTALTIAQKQNAVQAAQNALLQAQDSLQTLQAKTPADQKTQQDSVANLQENLQSKQLALNSTQKSTDISIQLKVNAIAQQKAGLTQAQKSLDDYRIVAPFDGVIRHIDYKVGDNLADTGNTEYVELENPGFIIVTIPLDQVDVVKVKKDLAATVTFDAVPGRTFDASIDNVDPIAVQQSGVVSYNVNVKLPNPADLNILSGMTATVQIETARKDNVLAVPNLALHSQAARKTVQLPDGTSVPVQTGVTDGQYTEITSGLQAGQSIVTVNVSRTAASAAGGANAAQQLLRGGGGGFGAAGGGFGAGGAGGAVRTRATN